MNTNGIPSMEEYIMHELLSSQDKVQQLSEELSAFRRFADTIAHDIKYDAAEPHNIELCISKEVDPERYNQYMRYFFSNLISEEETKEE